jgi:Fe-S-cluster-containing hydrogenase component 2
VQAIAVNLEVAEIDYDRCIGCGLCVGACPSEAMDLVVKPGTIVPPGKMGDLEAAIKGKGEESFKSYESRISNRKFGKCLPE